MRRPYTLTSTGPEQAWREITIRREAHGLFSRWLCDVDPDVAELAITAPSGSFIAELEDADPLLMLVAGIGVTPAIAVARARAAMTAGSPVVIDHSAQTQEHLVSEAELRDLAEATPACDTGRERRRAASASSAASPTTCTHAHTSGR